MVSDVTIGSALNQQAKTGAASTKLAEDFSQFLTLLTVQLQNQDPLSPMDTTEFTNQLVAFTGVEQQINTNQKLDSMVALQIGSAYSASQNYVGKKVSYVSSEFQFTGAPSEMRYSLDKEATVSKINIFNEAGKVVYSTDAAKTPGVKEFVWNGQLNNGGVAPPGTYQIRVDAIDSEENPIQANTVVSGVVRGTESQNGQIFLLVGERAVPLSNILNTDTPNGSGYNNAALTSALSYVGMDVSFLNTQIDYDGETSEDIIYSLDYKRPELEEGEEPPEEVRAKILIFNDSGEQVYSANVDNDPGRNLFRWDGKNNQGQQLPGGEYQFVIDAIDANDNRIPASSMGSGIVSGVETRGGTIFLNVGNRSLSLNEILSVDIPASNAQT
jgi:flagellar basal-body rod modification protein FlgD